MKPSQANINFNKLTYQPVYKLKEPNSKLGLTTAKYFLTKDEIKEFKKERPKFNTWRTITFWKHVNENGIIFDIQSIGTN